MPLARHPLRWTTLATSVAGVAFVALTARPPAGRRCAEG
jgi:hypothetical protein